MQFKKYVKLRKYVNGVPTDEYKKGNLIAVVQADRVRNPAKMNINAILCSCNPSKILFIISYSKHIRLFLTISKSINQLTI